MSDKVTRKWEATEARADLVGFRNVTFLAEHGAGPCRVVVPLQRDDMDAEHRVAGDDPANAIVPDDLAAFFVQSDPRNRFHATILQEART